MHHDYTADIALQIVTFYCLCDDFLRASGHRDDPQARSGSYHRICRGVTVRGQPGEQPPTPQAARRHQAMLSRSRLNRRLHAVPEALWQQMLWLLGQAVEVVTHIFRHVEAEGSVEGPYVVDSRPVAVCRNIRTGRCHLYPLRQRGELRRCYYAGKCCYYYGLKIHLLVTVSS